MNGFKEGDFTRRVEVTSMDEVGEVSTVFNDMVRDMKELIDTNYVIALKEKQSELDALQAQINPHFLYNALDTLYWKCIDADNEETGEDILALSQLFRLVLSRGNSIIPVSDEVKLLESYLHIQQILPLEPFQQPLVLRPVKIFPALLVGVYVSVAYTQRM